MRDLVSRLVRTCLIIGCTRGALYRSMTTFHWKGTNYDPVLAKKPLDIIEVA
jgi:hypothetical protein